MLIQSQAWVCLHPWLVFVDYLNLDRTFSDPHALLITTVYALQMVCLSVQQHLMTV